MMNFLNRIILLARPTFIICANIFFIGSAFANQNCPAAKYIQAEETLISARNTLDALYQHFQIFGACDDGELAEGYSDAVAQILGQKWGQFENFPATLTSNPEFKFWILKHIDSSASVQDLKKIIVNSDKCIRDRVDTLCGPVRTAAEKSVSELIQEK